MNLESNVKNILIHHHPRMVLGNYGICTYCGSPSNLKDHAIPVCYISRLPRGSVSKNMYGIGIQVYSCSFCNSMLGSKFFTCFTRRALYVSNRYAQKAEQKCGDWKKSELECLDVGLKDLIERNQTVKWEFYKRSDWFNSTPYLKNLECILYEPLLDKNHLKFKETYYEFFSETIDGVKQCVDNSFTIREERQRYCQENNGI